MAVPAKAPPAPPRAAAAAGADPVTAVRPATTAGGAGSPRAPAPPAAPRRPAAPPPPEFTYADEAAPARPRRVLWFLSGAGLGILVLALVAGLALLLRSDEDVATPSTQPVVTEATTPPRTATAPRTTTTAPDRPPAPLSPQLAAGRLSTSAFGPIQVGMSLDAAASAAGTTLDESSSGAGCKAYAPAGGPDGVEVFTADGAVAGFEITKDTVTTLSGVKVGDTADKVRSTYGAAIQSEPNTSGEGESLTFVPSGADDPNRVRFITDAGGIVRTMRAGRAAGPGGVEGCA